MIPPAASIRDALLELLAAVGAPPYRSARLLRAVERAQNALGHTPEPERDNRIVASDLPITGRMFSGELKGGSRMADKRSPSLRGLCENCDDPILVEFRHDLQLYLCGSCYAFQLHEMESQL